MSLLESAMSSCKPSLHWEALEVSEEATEVSVCNKTRLQRDPSTEKCATGEPSDQDSDTCFWV